MSITPVTQLFVDNIQFLSFGPIVAGKGTPNAGVLVLDLTLTVSLYQGRDITNPSITPGSLVTQFGNAGSVVVPHVGGGVYQVKLAPLSILTGTYQLVLDAPVSASGYQFHKERQVNWSTPS